MRRFRDLIAAIATAALFLTLASTTVLAADVPMRTGSVDPAGGTGITISVTLSIDPPNPEPGYDFCGSESVVAGRVGQTARWCYTITNNTAIVLSRHSLESSGLGSILVDFPYMLSPGASAFITATETITVARSDTGTWTAYNPGPVDVNVGSDSAELTLLPPVEFLVTASIDPVPLPPNYDFCGAESVITARAGQDVRWCYSISNLSGLTFQRHTLLSDRFGTMLLDFPYNLDPGASAFITFVETMGNTDLTESANWTVFNPGPADVNTVGASGRAISEVFADGFE